jgi:putative transposase
MHVAVTEHPTAAWTAQQLREAFPWDQAPRYLVHDRDRTFQAVKATAKAMGIEDVVTAPRSPWQNGYVERFIGSVRRQCLDHVIMLTENGLRRILESYVTYYTESRTHLALAKDSPRPRPTSAPDEGRVIVVAQVGGLHHRYERRAA